MSVIRHWPMQTERGWIVGASVIDTDTDPTTFTRKGAEDLARLLNNSQGAVEERDKLAAYLLWTFDPEPPAPMPFTEMRALLDRIGGQ